jgi:pimeloyl-ACP methyl ester carboxylesterase
VGAHDAGGERQRRDEHGHLPAGDPSQGRVVQYRARRGRVDLDHMAGLLNKPTEEFLPDLKGIIFESGFGDLFNIMNRLFGVGVLMGITRDKLVRWSNDTKIKQFTAPVLIIHGTEDFIIPVTEADVIFNSVPEGVPKRKVIIEGAGSGIIKVAHRDGSATITWQERTLLRASGPEVTVYRTSRFEAFDFRKA